MVMTNKLQGDNNLTNRGRGRPKGSKNKTTLAAKKAIEMAFEGLGGAERLTEWAKEDPDNERIFWQSIYTKLLPLDVKASGSFSVTLDSRTTKL